jgi:hypothetical protein
LDISAAKVVKILHVCKFFWILDMGYWILVRIKKERDITSNSFSIMKNTIY